MSNLNTELLSAKAHTPEHYELRGQVLRSSARPAPSLESVWVFHKEGRSALAMSYSLPHKAQCNTEVGKLRFYTKPGP